MKVKLILLEGSHEVTFVHRMRNLLAIAFIEPSPSGLKKGQENFPLCFGREKINLDSFYNKRRQDKYYNKYGVSFDLAPLFYFDRRTDSLIISWNYGGKTSINEVDNIFTSMENIVFNETIFAKEDITSFSVFIHTDADDSLEKSKQDFIGQFKDDNWLNQINDVLLAPNPFGIVTGALALKKAHRSYGYVDNVTVDLYMLATTPIALVGNLDTVIDQLINGNKHYDTISGIVNADDYKEKKYKHKSILGAIGQEYAAGSSNAVIIGNEEFITSEQIQDTGFFKAIKTFINN